MLKHIFLLIVITLGIVGLLGYDILQLENSIERNTRAVFNKEQFLLTQKIVDNINNTLKVMKQDTLYLRYSFAQIQLGRALMENNETEFKHWEEVLQKLYESFMASHTMYDKIHFIDLAGNEIISVGKKEHGELNIFKNNELVKITKSEILIKGKPLGGTEVTLAEFSDSEGSRHIAAVTPITFGGQMIGIEILYAGMEAVYSILTSPAAIQDEESHSVLFDINGKLIFCSRGMSAEYHKEESKVVAINPVGYAEIPESHGDTNVLIATNIFRVGENDFVLAILTSSDEMTGDIKKFKEKKQRIFILLFVIVVVFIIYFSIINSARIRSIEKSKMLIEVENLNSELKSANTRLMEIDRKKTDFLNIVAHDIRTPLTSIRAYADMLLINKDNPDVLKKVYNEFLGVIVKESERLGALISDYLDLARLESGTMKFDIVQIDMYGILSDLIKVYQAEAADKGVNLSLKTEHINKKIFGDDGKIRQVISNLLSNAIKFTPKDGNVFISLINSNNGAVMVMVEDTGPGISIENLEKVFGKFVQVEQEKRKITQGAGLGLYICREIIEHHGGMIWAESKPGQGSKFIFTLPEKNSDGFSKNMDKR